MGLAMCLYLNKETYYKDYFMKNMIGDVEIAVEDYQWQTMPAVGKEIID